jgi:hypothetical protein
MDIAGCDRLAQRVLERATAEQLEIHLRGKGHGVAASVLLGLCNGKLDAADEIVGTVSVRRGQRVAYRSADHHARSPIDIDRLGKQHDDAIRELHDPITIKPRHQQHELIVARAGDQRWRSQQCLETPADCEQDGIAAGVPEAVVDLLEAVEVDAKNRQRRGRRFGLLDERREACAQAYAVGQVGQCIGLRRVLGIRLAFDELAGLLPSPPHQQRCQGGEQ